MIMCLLFVFAALLEYAFVNVAARNGVRIRTPIVRQATLVDGGDRPLHLETVKHIRLYVLEVNRNDKGTNGVQINYLLRDLLFITWFIIYYVIYYLLRDLLFITWFIIYYVIYYLLHDLLFITWFIISVN